MQNDFIKILGILDGANVNYKVRKVDGEHDCITIPSDSEYYDTGVCFGFNEDGGLFAIHPYEPDEGEE